MKYPFSVIHIIYHFSYDFIGEVLFISDNNPIRASFFVIQTPTVFFSFFVETLNNFCKIINQSFTILRTEVQLTFKSAAICLGIY